MNGLPVDDNFADLLSEKASIISVLARNGRKDLESGSFLGSKGQKVIAEASPGERLLPRILVFLRRSNKFLP